MKKYKMKRTKRPQIKRNFKKNRRLKRSGKRRTRLIKWFDYQKFLRSLEQSVSSKVNNAASISGSVTGLINIIIQIPINLGDSKTNNESDENSTTEVL